MSPGLLDFMEELSDSYNASGEIPRRDRSESDDVRSCVERVNCSTAGL